MIEQLHDFVTRSRWFGGKGLETAVTGSRVLAQWPGDPVVQVLLVELRTGEEHELYQVPLALYAQPQERLEHAAVGAWDDPEHGHVHAYDAVHDRDAMSRWLREFDAAAGHTGTVDEMAFHRLPGHDLDLDVHSTAFSGEQSNSSVMFGEDSLLKLFRKVTPGRNPDVSVHEVLTRHGTEHVAQLYGWVETTDGELTLGMLQQFLRTATDGWDLALASVRNLFAEADLHAEEVGGDFAAEAARLGAALAEVHHVLAAEFPTQARGSEAMRDLADAMHGRLDRALAAVPDLAAHEAVLRATYDDVAHHPGDVAQQIHGDLHLGQTLRTVRGWKIVDFEGEPAKPLAERLLPDSPWRDVAGMMRSFDYATGAVAMTALETDPDGLEQRRFRAAEWSSRNQEAFLAAYAGRELTDAEQALLTAYVVDKAVYEAVYEARNRPGWLSIPLDAIERLVP